jgi:hypothetical protein
MIDFTEIRRVIEETLKNEFSMCPIEYENVFLDDPDVPEYISTFHYLDTSEMVSPGVSASTGGIIIVVNTPVGEGTERSREIATELSRILSNRSFGIISTQEAELHSYPMEAQDVYFKQNLIIPYTHGMGEYC